MVSVKGDFGKTNLFWLDCYPSLSPFPTRDWLLGGLYVEWTAEAEVDSDIAF